MSFKSLFRSLRKGNGGIARVREQAYQEAVNRGETPEDAQRSADKAAQRRRAGGAAAAGGLSGTIG